MKYILLALLLPVVGAAQTTKIEAESYTDSKGVQTENTSDSAGGKNVGYIDSADYIQYPVTVLKAGKYNVGFRIASIAATASFYVSVNGVKNATIVLPNTGGYQNWKTVNYPMSLPAGKVTIRITAVKPLWNINWIAYTYLPPVYEEIKERDFIFNFPTSKWLIIYADGTKSDSMAMPPRPLREKD